jgi:hypothetical protein
VGIDNPRNTDVYAISDRIEIPPNYYWRNVTLSKECPPGSSIAVSVLDGDEDPIPGYQDLDASKIDISSLDPFAHRTIRLQAHLTSSGSSYPSLLNWTVTGVEEVFPVSLQQRGSHLVRTVGYMMDLESHLNASVEGANVSIGIM